MLAPPRIYNKQRENFSHGILFDPVELHSEMWIFIRSCFFRGIEGFLGLPGWAECLRVASSHQQYAAVFTRSGTLLLPCSSCETLRKRENRAAKTPWKTHRWRTRERESPCLFAVISPVKDEQVSVSQNGHVFKKERF